MKPQPVNLPVGTIVLFYNKPYLITQVIGGYTYRIFDFKEKDIYIAAIRNDSCRQIIYPDCVEAKQC